MTVPASYNFSGSLKTRQRSGDLSLKKCIKTVTLISYRCLVYCKIQMEQETKI